MKSVVLRTGQRMPLVGLGTWQAAAGEVERAVDIALQAGYRHIDTAYNYNNEEAIGITLKGWLEAGKLKREDVFITTKLPHIGNRAADVAKYLDRSLQRLQLDYVDLYLVHMPFGFIPDSSGEVPAVNDDGRFVLDLETNHVAVWEAMEKQVDAGKTKAIGVSNFNLSQLEKVIVSSRIHPANVQVEMHAYLQQNDLRTFCEDHEIVVTAYSPLGSPGSKAHWEKKYNYSPENFPDLLGHTTVKQVAEDHGKTPGQVLLRHLVQKGVVVIPKSTSPERITQNIQIFDFELTSEEMQILDNLDHGEQGRILDFGFFKGVKNHPEYPFKITKKTTIDATSDIVLSEGSCQCTQDVS